MVREFEVILKMKDLVTLAFVFSYLRNIRNIGTQARASIEERINLLTANGHSILQLLGHRPEYAVPPGIRVQLLNIYDKIISVVFTDVKLSSLINNGDIFLMLGSKHRSWVIVELSKNNKKCNIYDREHTCFFHALTWPGLDVGAQGR